MVRELWSKVDGYKTYIIAAGVIIFALTQLWAGAVSPQEAFEMAMAALGFSALRHGVSKMQ